MDYLKSQPQTVPSPRHGTALSKRDGRFVRWIQGERWSEEREKNGCRPKVNLEEAGRRGKE